MNFLIKYKRLISETSVITLSNFVVAMLVNNLAWKNQLVSGGLTGFSIIINYLTSIPVGQTLLTINILLVILAIIIIGKGPGSRAIYGFVSLSFLIDLTREIFHITQVPSQPFFINLMLIIILSISMGIGVSIVLANNYSVGAYSTIYLIIKQFYDVPAQNVFFTIDFLLATITTLFFGIDRGGLLVVNAFVAYFVVKITLPKVKLFFENIYAKD